MTRLATLRVGGGTRAVRLDGDVYTDLGHPTLREHFEGGPADSDAGRTYPADGASLATVVPNPSKIVCVGHNYRNHIQEMGREIPSEPVLFAKFAETLIGPYDDIQAPLESEQIDWEAELVIVIGKKVRKATEAEAEAAIAGFTIMDDISERDWQFRTMEWLKGKVWEATTPVGPHVVTPDELPGGVRPTLQVELTVDGVTKQKDNTADFVFDPVFLVRYISTIITLNPGDLIATGTSGGVGHGRTPAEYLSGGEEVVVSIEGLGELRNKVARV